MNLTIILFIIILSVALYIYNIWNRQIFGGNDNFKDMLKHEGYLSNEIQVIMNSLYAEKIKEPLIDSLSAKLKYRTLPKNRYTYRIHIGQRKLLMNEILFMTKYGHLSDKVVYAGAAHGIHIPLLAQLFPKHKFDLWDPGDFKISDTNQIKIFNKYFTDEIAATYKGQKILFISDIRTGNPSMSFEEFEKEVETNNQWQRNWIEIMKPSMSMLKFRIPFTIKEKYEYFSGDIYLQPWAPVDSAETRLITDGKQMQKYDLIDYENRMYYYNNILREFQWIKHNIPTNKVKGLCHCHDCTYEIYIWKKCFEKQKFKGNKLHEKIIWAMNEANDIIGRTLFIKDHGKFPMLRMPEKRKKLESL